MMQGNWSLILNILLLAGVIYAIVRMIKARRESSVLSVKPTSQPPVVGEVDRSLQDDIIAVRKITPDASRIEQEPSVHVTPKIQSTADTTVSSESSSTIGKQESPTVMIFLLAKDNRQLAGYELLQTVLAAGLRFGEGHLFHRHQYMNGQGPVLCSLAAATPSGVFDLQNIGAFVVKGLCLFMHASGNPTIDAERFEIMLETAKQLSEGLDTKLLDDQRRPFNEQSLARYHRMLNIELLATSV